MRRITVSLLYVIMHILEISTVVILLKATKRAERVQLNKPHWLNNVSRAHIIGRERFPKHHF